MKRAMTMMLMVVVTGCGAGAGGGAKIGGGKQGAASAASALSAPTKAAANRSATTGTTLTDLAYDCPRGGSAKMSNFQASVTSTTVSQTYTLTFTNCALANSSAGEALYSGSVTVTQSVAVGTGVQVAQSFKGKVNVEGAFSDFVDADFTQTVDVSSLGQDGDVSVVMKGTVATSAGSYTYDETVNVTNGTLSVQTSP